jgi:signal transduction histidine kinase
MRRFALRLALALACILGYFLVAVSFQAKPASGATLVAALLALPLGLFVFRKDARSPVNRAFLALCTALACYQMIVYLLQMATVIGIQRVERAVWVLRFGNLLFPPVIVYFTYHFLGGRDRWLRVLAWVSLASVAPLLILSALGLYIKEYVDVGVSYVPKDVHGLYRYFAVVTILWVFASAGAVLYKGIRAPSRDRRMQYILFLIGWAFAAVPGLLGFIPAFRKPWFPSFSGLSTVCFPLVLSVAILRYQLFDIKVIIRRTLPYAVGTALMGVAYAGCIAALQALGSGMDLLGGTERLVLLFLLVGVAFQPTLELIQSGLDRLFFRSEAEMDRFLAEASVRYRQAASLSALARSLASDAAQALRLKGAAVLLGTGTVSEAVTDSGRSWLESAGGLPIPSGSPGPWMLADERDGSLDLGREGQSLAGALQAAEVRAVVAITTQATSGFLACKEKLSDLAFTPRDRTFLCGLAAQAELALAKLDADRDAKTARHISAAMFESLVNTAVALVDAEGCLLSCNRTFESAFRSSTGRLSDFGISHAHLLQAATAPIEVALGGRTFIVSTRQVESGEGTTLVVLTDVTELRGLQERDRRRQVLAELGMTVSAINHEIGNILAPMDHYMNKLSRLCTTEEAKSALNAALQRVKALDGLTRELRAYYRDPELSLRNVSLGDVVAGALGDMAALVGGTWVPPRTEGLDLQVRADAQKLKQIFVNLLKNGWQAMQETGCTDWSISAKRQDGKVRIEVRDTGSGIPPELVGRVFEPFFTTKKERGTGLGLAIVRRIVEAHGAEISVESTPGKGATFTLVWPPAP